MGPISAAACNVIVGLASMAAVATGVRLSLPLPDDGDLAAKWEYFREHKDEFDLLLFGSSTVGRGVVAPLLDEQLARRGLDLRSFNWGIDGMMMFESGYWLERVLALRPARLRWVVVELDDWVPRRPSNPEFGTERSIAWHGWRQTSQVVRSWLLSEHPPGWKYRLSRNHIELMFQRNLNLGLVPRLLRAHAHARVHEEPLPPLTDDNLNALAGYRAMPSDVVTTARRRLLGDVPAYQERVAAIDAASEPPALDRYNMHALGQFTRLFSSAGVEPIYLVMPTVSLGRRGFAETLGDAGHLGLVLDYQKPARHPELFELAARYDADHLTHTGAERLTHLLAEDLAPLLGAPPTH